MPKAMRICANCTAPTRTTRCALHQREYEQARGTSTQRGYGSKFQRASKQAKANATHCVECGQPFTPDNPATGGHRAAIRNGGSLDEGIVAQCRRCNYGWRRTGL